MDEKFWTDDPSIIIKNYYVIIPTNKMNRIQQLNTVTRFLIYFLILCLLFDIGTHIIIILLIGIILIVIFYHIYASDPIGIQNDLIAETDAISEKFNGVTSSCENCKKDNSLNKPLITLYDGVKNKVFKGNSNPNKKFIAESGYIDSDGKYRIGPDYSEIDLDEYQKQERENKKKKVSWGKNKKYNEDTCRKPTVENPFANIVFSDYLDAGNIAEPCNVDNNEINAQMQNLYNSSIYRNLEDVWERENSQRMFYTMPIQTVPNSQTDFANWLYKTGPTCHENTEACTYFESPNMTSSRY